VVGLASHRGQAFTIETGTFTEPEVSSTLIVELTPSNQCILTWEWSFNTVITGFDIVVSDTEPDDDMFPSIFSSAVQLVDVDYAGVLAEMVLNPEPTTIEIPAWAYMVFKDAMLDIEDVATDSTLPKGTNTAIVHDYEGPTVLGMVDGEILVTRSPFQFPIAGPPLNCENTILQGTVCADKKIVDLPMFRFVTEEVTLCNAFSTTASMEPTLFFQFFAPTVSPPPPTGDIVSDPHFVGLLNQKYDVTGVKGGIYALLSDYTFLMNARFAAAYTTGFHVEHSTYVTKPMRPRGTWIDQVGIVVADDAWAPVSLVVTVELPPAVVEVSDEDTLALGTVEVNGIPITAAVGSYEVGTDGAAAGRVCVVIEVHQTFGRVSLDSPDIEVAIDLVAPPLAWGVAPYTEEAVKYTHLNLHMIRVAASERLHGLIGVSSRMKYDEDGAPILEGRDKNGAGILDGAVEDYRVSSILSAEFQYSVFPDVLMP